MSHSFRNYEYKDNVSDTAVLMQQRSMPELISNFLGIDALINSLGARPSHACEGLVTRLRHALIDTWTINHFALVACTKIQQT